MVEYIMKKEICGTFHAKCGTRDLTSVFGTVPRKAGRVVTQATMGSNSETFGSIDVKYATDRQTDMDGPIRCSSLTPEPEQRVKGAFVVACSV
jgi:hypothetical protein